MHIASLDHMVIRTHNFNAMVDFYTKALGMTLQEEKGRFSVHFGTQKINLHPLEADIQPVARNPQPGSFNYCLRAEGDPQRIRAQLEQAGFPSVEPKIFRRHGAMGDFDSFYLFDPDENLVEIGVYEPSDRPFSVTGIDHMVIVTDHFDDTFSFYRDLLGMAGGKNDTQSTVSFGTQKFNIHPVKPLYKPAEKNAAYGNSDFCLLVNVPIEQVQQELLQAGAEIELGIIRRNGAAGPLNSIYLRDPDGNLVELSAVVGSPEKDT